MATTTTTQVPPAVQAQYDRNLLERATPLLVYEKFGQRRPLKSKNGDTIKFRRYNSLPPATTPLTEGVKPTGSQLSVTDITATIAQYGDFVELTDKVELTVEDPVVMEASDVLGEQAGLTLDTVARDILISGTNVVYANGATDRASTSSTPLASDLDLILKVLEGQNAKKFTQMITGSTKINTVPVAPAYIGIIHTDKIADFEKLSDFVPVEKYAYTGKIYDGEIGKYKRIRLIATTNAPIFADAGTDGTNTWDIYGTLVVAQDAYGVVPMTGQRNGQIIVKPLGSAGSADPLNQISTVGWKAWYTVKILNDAFMVRYEHA